MPQASPRIRPLQRLLSYFRDEELERASSAYTDDLRVVLRDGRIELHASSVLYSRAERYSSFIDAFAQMRIGEMQADSLLLLGLGLGSIPQILDKRYGLRPACTAVEVDPAVLALFRRWAPESIRDRMDLIEGDACRFIEEELAEPGRQRRWDLICVDLFTDRFIPDCAERDAFLTGLQRHCRPGGSVLFSRLRGSRQEHLSNTGFLRRFRRYFPGARLLRTSGNDVLWGRAAGHRAP